MGNGNSRPSDGQSSDEDNVDDLLQRLDGGWQKMQRTLASLQETEEYVVLSLHRSKCKKLGLLYAKIMDVLARFKSYHRMFDPEGRGMRYFSGKVIGILKAFLHVMLECERFIRDCTCRLTKLHAPGVEDQSQAVDEWVWRATGGLLLTTEALDSHLDELLCCVKMSLWIVQESDATRTFGSLIQRLILGVLQSKSTGLEELSELWQTMLTNAAGDSNDSVAVFLTSVRNGRFVEEIFTREGDVADLDMALRSLEQQVCANHPLQPFLHKQILDFRDSERRASQLATLNRVPECLRAKPGDFKRHSEPLGEGTYGKVFAVSWLGVEKFAIKDFSCMPFKMPADSEKRLLDFLEKEAGMQACLHHPNILQLACCTTNAANKSYSLVTERMDGSLRDLLDNELEQEEQPEQDIEQDVDERPFTLLEAVDIMLQIARGMEDVDERPFTLLGAVDIMLQIARGMEYLHSLDIMHRDLKSPNVLVRVSKQPCYWDTKRGSVKVKITDFGNAKAKMTDMAAELSGDTENTMPPGGVLASRESSSSSQPMFTTLDTGTILWMAPEVFTIKNAKLQEKYSKSADVYSFAIICAEILTGEVPFKDLKEAREASKHHQKLLEGVRPRLPSDCPEPLAVLIRRCWHTEASKRPQFDRIAMILRDCKCSLIMTNSLDQIGIVHQDWYASLM